jgi:hypothetical protein
MLSFYAATSLGNEQLSGAVQHRADSHILVPSFSAVMQFISQIHDK